MIGAIFGALTTAILFYQRRRSILIGAGVGLLVGAISGQILMLPTQHCAFEAGPLLSEENITLDTWTLEADPGQMLSIAVASDIDIRIRLKNSEGGSEGTIRTRDAGFAVDDDIVIPDDGLLMLSTESRQDVPGEYTLTVTTADRTESELVESSDFRLQVGQTVEGKLIERVDTVLNQDFVIGGILVVFSGLLLLIPLWMWIVQGRKLFQAGALAHTERFGRSWLPYLFLLPTLIILVLFLYYPMVDVITLSFESSQLGANREFVCVTNYVRLIGDSEYMASLTATMILTTAIVVLSMAAGLGVALLASQRVRYANVYRTLLIWPYALSPVVTGTIFLIMFNPQVGIVNQILNNLFGVRPSWFSDPLFAPWVIILAAVWNNLGFNILFYIAGLQNVPDSLLEAAAIDGATAWQRFTRITFPMLSPFTFFLLITNITYGVYNIFGTVDTLTQGTGGTEVLIYKLFRDAFEFRKTGSASAQSLILFLIVAVLTVLQFRYVESQVSYAE